MRIVFAVALSFCAFLAALAAPSGGPSPAASRPAVSPLHGTVLDSGGSGIADARVELIPDEAAVWGEEKVKPQSVVVTEGVTTEVILIVE